jgi:K+-sensing histidine kinase KdpD
MPQGGRLRIATEAKRDSIVVSFTDSGIGMSREVREKIFEPFFTTKGVTGMGLGLAVSYGTIERYGGRIEAKSKPGRGTTFTITLPSSTTDVEALSNRSREVEAANALALDDDAGVGETLVGMLNSSAQRTDHI